MDSIDENNLIEQISTGVALSNNYDIDLYKKNIMASIAIAITENNSMRKDIDIMYEKDREKYYNAAKNFSGYNHIIITQGKLEQEIYAKKALGILICAEIDKELRGKVIRHIRKYYPELYKVLSKGYFEIDAKLIKKHNNRYDNEMALPLLNTLLYLFLYKGMDVSGKYLADTYKKILIEIIRYESTDSMTENINEGIENCKETIKNLKKEIKRTYGNLNCYKDIMENKDEFVITLGRIIKHILITEKINVEYISLNDNYLNVDNIYLAYIRSGNMVEKIGENNLVIFIVIGIMVKILANQYKNSKQLYFKDFKETLYHTIKELSEENKVLKEENYKLNKIISGFQVENNTVKERVKIEIDAYKDEHLKEVYQLKKEIKNLNDELLEEQRNKEELKQLRELLFNIQGKEYVPKESKGNLKDYSKYKSIVIVGGSLDWRKKIKEKYPEILTIDGFNENFEISILNNVDFIFFYTGYMNHATYYRVINFIKNKEIRIGYIGKTNIQLVENEMIEELDKYY